MALTREEHLLSCLAEECTEVGQRCSKALRFGLREVQPGQPYSNAERIILEYLDLIAVVRMLQEEGTLPAFQAKFDADHMEEKAEKVEKFMRYAVEQGAMATPNPLSSLPCWTETGIEALKEMEMRRPSIASS